MESKEIIIGGVQFKVCVNGRVWVIRDGDEIEIGTGNKSIYKNYFVKEIKKSIYIHRIVATAYIPNPKNKPCVNHIDGNRLNNNVNNLEWATHSQNMAHNYARKFRSRKNPYT